MRAPSAAVRGASTRARGSDHRRCVAHAGHQPGLQHGRHTAGRVAHPQRDGQPAPAGRQFQQVTVARCWPAGPDRPSASSRACAVCLQPLLKPHLLETAGPRSLRSFGKPLRVAEMNSISNSGRNGVSNVFSSALWTLDSALEVAQTGAVGINLHQVGIQCRTRGAHDVTALQRRCVQFASSCCIDCLVRCRAPARTCTVLCWSPHRTVTSSSARPSTPVRCCRWRWAGAAACCHARQGRRTRGALPT